jgi:transposase
MTIGVDVGDRFSQVCEVSGAGEEVQSTKIPTTPAQLTRYFAGRARCRVVLEVGTHSPWITRLVTELGHEVLVANPSHLYGQRRRRKRNDRLDAAFLARQGRADPSVLHPIMHRQHSQAHLALLRARDQVVRARARLINHLRGTVKPMGARVRSCRAAAFPGRAQGGGAAGPRGDADAPARGDHRSHAAHSSI